MRTEHAKGAANELIAASFFLKNGFEVFWPAVQQSGTDFIVYSDEGFKRVQVKTAYWNKSGRNNYLQCRISRKDSTFPVCDLLAVVYNDELWVIEGNKLDSACVTLRNQNTGENFYVAHKTH